MRRASYRPAARADIRNALKTSSRDFGPHARRAYKTLIDHAVAMLCADACRAGVRRIDDLSDGVFLFHLRHARARGALPKDPRHLIVFTCDDAAITILRVLHDSMDVPARTATEPDKP